MANQNQIAQYTPEVLEVYKPEVLQVIRTSICPTATDAEFVLFAHKAATYGLDPFKNEIFFIKYGNTARIQFAAEAYLSKAREKEGFQPPDTQMVCENDDFRITKNPETKEMEVARHEIGFPRGSIIGAYSISYREGYRPVTVIIDRSEIEHMFTGQNKENWNKWTSDMFGKFVEQRALKKQYGLDLNDDEIPQNGVVNNTSYEPVQRKDITEEANAASTQKPTEQPKSPPAETEEQAMRRILKEIKPRLDQLGIPSNKGVEQQAARSQFYTEIGAKFKDPDMPTVAELKTLLKLLDQQIEMRNFGADDELPL